MLLLESRTDRVHARLCLSERDACLETADYSEHMRSPISGPARVVGHRQPELLLILVERDATVSGGPYRVDSGRHNACYCVTTTIQRNRLVDDRAVAAIMTSPKSISQDHHLVFSRLVLFGMKQAPDHRLYADHCKVSGASIGSHHLHRLTIAG